MVEPIFAAADPEGGKDPSNTDGDELNAPLDDDDDAVRRATAEEPQDPQTSAV